MFKGMTRDEIKAKVFPWVGGAVGVLCLVWLMACIFVTWWMVLIVPLVVCVLGLIFCGVMIVVDGVSDFVATCLAED